MFNLIAAGVLTWWYGIGVELWHTLFGYYVYVIGPEG